MANIDYFNKNPENKITKGNNKPINKLKMQPHSVESEQAVLGCLMVDPSYWEKVSLNLNVEDFYKNEHIYIFTAMLSLVLEQKQIDIITISEHLDIKGNLVNAGGLLYLSEITNNTQNIANIDIYIEIIKRKSKLRKLVQIGNNIIDYCYTPGEKTLTELLSEVEYKLQKVIEIKKTDVLQTPISIAKIFKRTIRTIDKLAETKNSVTGLPTGFTELDKLTSGLQPANLVILAGRPSMGKTTLALNIAEHILLNTKKSIIFFSMEMQAEQLAVKLLASLSRINIQNLSTGKITNDDWKKLSTNISLITAKKLFIDDTGSLNPMEVRNKIQKTIRKSGKTSLIIIDYLQLMKIPSTKETRTTEISEITRSLKALAKELNVPILVLSQLNRNLEQRQDKRPMLSDLRESGAIEQDADLILFIYRDEVYNQNTKNKKEVEIILGKQRNGPTGMVKLRFIGENSRFENYIIDKK